MYGKGRRPKYCPAHRDPRNLARDIGKMRENYGEAIAAEFAQAAGRPMPGANTADGRHLAVRRALLPEMMAIGLARTSDLREAAAIMGCGDLADEEIELAAAKARDQHKALTELRATSIGKISLEAIAEGLVYARTLIPTMGPAQVAPLLKTLATIHEQLTGGGDGVFSEITMVVAPFTEEPQNES